MIVYYLVHVAFLPFSRRSAPPYLGIINGTVIFPPNRNIPIATATTPLPAWEDVTTSPAISYKRYTYIMDIYYTLCLHLIHIILLDVHYNLFTTFTFYFSDYIDAAIIESQRDTSTETARDVCRSKAGCTHRNW